ncbi:MAG: hypothetical protein BIP78_1134 [Candidatus Bipolaricaulis sibiricus]|uniref:Uncharacterized protein n=1 Tax=Bipolaricaulis sibiricus TaxID=2501609 RepID=A0A410FVH2_BIPS1|nr:MAG: hypothetical protein BIP78_1134 [Candidatus Bipolaricaulis sibiricus]
MLLTARAVAKVGARLRVHGARGPRGMILSKTGSVWFAPLREPESPAKVKAVRS